MAAELLKSCMARRSQSIGPDNVDDNLDKFSKNERGDNDEKIPYLGQIFGSLLQAESFYRNYGITNGFEIKIRTTHRHARSTNQVSSRLYVCKKDGKSIPKLTSVEESQCTNSGKRKRQRECAIKTGCQARMFVVHRLNTEKYEVTSLELQHNHEIVVSGESDLIKRESDETHVATTLIGTLNQSSIEASGVLNGCSQLGALYEKVECDSQKFRNVQHDQRHSRLDNNDAQAGIDFLRKLNMESLQKFFYRVEVDDQNQLKCILWVDPRCLIAYQNFGDVVMFDTAYRTNGYSMSFVPFIGVNHHFQHIFFGFALMRDESEPNYCWVLNKWLEAMNYKYPVAIITKPDTEIGNAIAEVMPQTYHLVCTWHISNEYPKKLSTLYSKYPTMFEKDFDRCILSSFTPNEFEERWSNLLELYKLQDHSWLQQIYDARHKWVSVYTRDIFAAGMTTTSRSEKMNPCFDLSLSTTAGIRELVEKAEKALERQSMSEKKLDYETSHCERALQLHSPLEYHASRIYTKEIFRRFQIELFKSHQLSIVKMRTYSTAKLKTYDVYNPMLPEHKRAHFRIESNTVDGKVKCICKMFEHSGMLCHHILRFLSMKSVTEIPESFIAHRWTRNANRVGGKLLNSTVQSTNLEHNPTMRYNSLCMAYQNWFESGMCSMERYNYAMDVLVRETPNLGRFPVEGMTDEITDEPFEKNRERID